MKAAARTLLSLLWQEGRSFASPRVRGEESGDVFAVHQAAAGALYVCDTSPEHDPEPEQTSSQEQKAQGQQEAAKWKQRAQNGGARFLSFNLRRQTNVEEYEREETSGPSFARVRAEEVETEEVREEFR